MGNLPRLEVCLSPALLHLFDTKGTVVVIIDVFRATSTIAAALHNGAKCVIPVASVPECIELGTQIENSITAGERDGKVAEGLEYGNSPLEYPRAFVEGKTLVLTTTNGTRLLHMVQDADTIITGSFLNLGAVCDFLAAQGKNVVLGCAAWKDRFNMEDTLFAGAVVSRIGQQFDINCDSARGAKNLYESSGGGNFINFLQDSSHYRRLSGFGLVGDMEYCTTPDLHPVVPILKGRELVVHS
ncbi:MAG TPA: 2-phosphosulfolactate phosphatase [Flavipsychrobacter sp.]|nr:2-phosphosulfolactate phosphatase [Flavipsychrobacter sp.]